MTPAPLWRCRESACEDGARGGLRGELGGQRERRCGEAGDERGSTVEAALLVRDLIRRCLLRDRRCPPKDPDIRELRRAGAVDQFVGSAEVLSRPDLARAAADAVTGIAPTAARPAPR
ncbi:hypothetical protein [Streptomyces sp. Ag109_O5-10]|uniref:hypothetical protein n=1 Tax=Streptomyces sp. Ag109_O5-10 TaxID=1855349 RepID=UPI00089BDFCF|nr:hypothetical protein SAMN05216533_1160 [Streptomyces sp. Ag109_O5-10]